MSRRSSAKGTARGLPRKRAQKASARARSRPQINNSRPERSEQFGKPSAEDAIAAENQDLQRRSEEHTSELQSLMRISYAVFCLQQKKDTQKQLTKKTI